MATRFEWAGVSFELLNPEQVREFADDGNPDDDWGLAFSTGSNGCMIVGSLDDLRQMGLDVAREAGEQA